MSIASITGFHGGRRAIHGVSLALLIAVAPAPVHAMVRIHPTAILLEGSQRAASVTLTNTGSETETYRLSFEAMRMTEQGELVPNPHPSPEERPADALLRFTPRQVTLRPGASQVVRFRVSKPRDLAAGEYRSHFTVKPLPGAGTSQRSIEGGDDPQANALSIAFIPRINVSIPILVRHGNPGASVSLSNLKLARGATDQDPHVLTMDLDRSGDRSVWGEAIATYVPEGGSGTIVGKTLLTLMAPTPKLKVKLPLRFQDSGPGKGRLQVVFHENGSKGKRQVAESSLVLP